jgi:hypothetical protein
VTAVWTELGKKFAERWLNLLVLPGLLYVGLAYAGFELGHTAWWRLDRLRAPGLATEVGSQSTGTVLLIAAGLLLLAAGAGLAAQGLSSAVSFVWMGEWRIWPAGPLVAWRRRRWQEATRAYNSAVRRKALIRVHGGGEEPPDTAWLHAARSRICLVPPSRPTWLGDRMAATDGRVLDAYDLDLASAWPRLWLVLPDPVRQELRDGKRSYDSATSLAGWGILYLPLAVVCWPAALIGLGIALVGWRRARTAIGGYADLVEAAVDLHGITLAKELGITAEALTPAIGLAITRIAQKSPV